MPVGMHERVVREELPGARLMDSLSLVRNFLHYVIELCQFTAIERSHLQPKRVKTIFSSKLSMLVQYTHMADGA